MGAEQEQAFVKLKEDQRKYRRIKHYDPEAQTALTTDASTKGLGATLLQIDERGRKRLLPDTFEEQKKLCS